MFRDITERRHVEKRLRLLSEAVEQSSEGLVLIRLDGTVMFLNRAFAEMHGLKQDEVIGKDISTFHLPEQMDAVYDANCRIMTDGIFTGEIWHARADGSVFPGLEHHSVLQDQDGRPISLIGTLRDITQIKKTEEALRKSHDALEAKVAERTRDLEQSRMDLKRYSESLEQANAALKIVIQGIDEKKRVLENRITENLNLSVRPIFDQLKTEDVSDTVAFLLQSLEYNVTNVLASFGFGMVKHAHKLTPKEMKVCEMVRSGLSSKQIAKIMGISAQTVLVHRKNIRKKLSLEKSRKNLATFLRTMRP